MRECSCKSASIKRYMRAYVPRNPPQALCSRAEKPSSIELSSPFLTIACSCKYNYNYLIAHANSTMLVTYCLKRRVVNKSRVSVSPSLPAIVAREKETVSPSVLMRFALLARCHKSNAQGYVSSENSTAPGIRGNQPCLSSPRRGLACGLCVQACPEKPSPVPAPDV